MILFKKSTTNGKNFRKKKYFLKRLSFCLEGKIRKKETVLHSEPSRPLGSLSGTLKEAEAADTCHNQGYGSAFIFCGSGTSSFSKCGSGSSFIFFSSKITLYSKEFSLVVKNIQDCSKVRNNGECANLL